MRKDWETVMIESNTKELLKELKQKQSYDKLILSMAVYFKDTGYDPFTARPTPLTDIREEFARLISDYLAPIKEVIESDTTKNDIDRESIKKLILKLRSEARQSKNNPMQRFIDKNTFDYILQSIENELF